MLKIALILGSVLLVVLIGGGAYLATIDPPANRQRVEQVLPNDRFPQ